LVQIPGEVSCGESGGGVPYPVWSHYWVLTGYLQIGFCPWIFAGFLVALIDIEIQVSVIVVARLRVVHVAFI
jgi:hypothetical protein